MRVAFLLFFLACLRANAQVTPLEPVPGDTLRFSYTPLLAEPVYAGLVIEQQDGSMTHTHILLHRTGATAQGAFRLPERSASVRIRFYTLQKDDEGAAQSLIVYEPDRRTPVRGAYLNALFGDHPDSLFALELRNDPGNYLAYAHYFNIASMLSDPGQAQRKIMVLCVRLDSVYHTSVRTPGLLAALCVGYAKSERLDTARRFLFALFRDYPLFQETAFAFSIYNYEYYKASNKDIEPLVLDSLKTLFQRFPLAKISGDPNVLYFMGKDSTIPLSGLEAAYAPLYRENRVPYYALNGLPGLYIDRRQHLDSARALLSFAIRLFEDGSIQHQYRLTANHFKTYVPELLMDLGRLDLMQGEPSEALLHTSAALDILHGTNAEGNFRPGLLKIRAEAYRKLGNYAMALEDGAVREKAPDLEGVDLRGDTLRLASLRGKVVVLNFWGTGCGPCIAEMPELNTLVEKYNDVVFLGLTADDRERLPAFFKKHLFRYTVVAVPSGTFGAFHVEGMPVHIVLNRKGEIVSRSVGSRPDIVAFLEGAIAEAR